MTWVLRIKEFISYIKIEKGLSDNTCFAYQQDLAKLVDFCVPRGLAVEEVRYEHLKEFVALLFDLGLSARSQARIISGVKQFFGFLLTEQILSRDPSEMLEQPKLGRKLPEVLITDCP